MSARSYDDLCGVARTLDAVGERWALLIVRELVLGPKRFGDLRHALGISQNVLSQRLRELGENGIVEQVRLGPPASTVAYELTAVGREIEPVLLAMARWGVTQPAPADADLGHDAFVLMLKAFYSPAQGAFHGHVHLVLEPDRYEIDATGAILGARRSSGAPSDLEIAGDPIALRAVVTGDATLASMIADGRVQVIGDPARASAFLRLFPVRSSSSAAEQCVSATRTRRSAASKR